MATNLINTASDFLSPIVMQAHGSMPAVEGGTVELDSISLKNPNRSAMLVDAIRFRWPIQAAIVNQTNYIGSQLCVEMWYGGTQLFNGPTPIAAFAPVRVTYLVNPSTAIFVLPKPLYVPPDVPIRVKFTQVSPQPGTVVPVANIVAISMIARSIPLGWPVPEKVYVPWVSSTSVRTAVATYASKDNELGNPFDVPLHMTRLVGWNGKLATRPGLVAGAVASVQTIYANRAPEFTVQATFSNQKMLIRDATPFYAVFPGERPFMKLNNTIQPQEFIRLYLDVVPAGTATPAGYGIDADLQFTTVGLIGYREIDTPQGALP